MTKNATMPTLHKLTADRLLGIDLASDPSVVSAQRSPHGVNMLRSTPGCVEKRPGYKQIAAYDGAIHGCYMVGGTQLLHAGRSLYADGERLDAVVADAHSAGCCFGGKLYLLDGSEFWQVSRSTDGWTVHPVSESAYLPRIAVGKNPDGSGGSELEDVNLLSDAWCESFYGTAGAVDYQLEFGGLSGTAVRVELVRAAETGTTRVPLTEGGDFTVNRTTGVVHFLAAPGTAPVEGEDNVFITASRDRSAQRRRITQADVCTTYGQPGLGLRLFVTGAPEWKNRDFWSAADDPTYFSDLSYSILGADEERILGYSLIGDSLAAHKSGDSGSVWVRTAETKELTDALGNSRQVMAFCTGSVISGYGGVAKNSFAVLGDEPLFLTAQGVFALTASELTGVRYQQRRSWYIDPQLCREPELARAQAVVWNDFYLLAVNGHIWCLDGLQKSYTANAPKSSFQYECYLLDGIPADRLWTWEGRLYFGTADGRVCVFSQEGVDAFTDRMTGLAPRAIPAVWETPDLSGEDFYREKKFRHLAVRLQPAPTTSMLLYACREGVWRLLNAEPFQARYFSFANLTFSKMTFSCDVTSRTLGIRLHRYRMDKIRFRFENSEANEPFGLLGWAMEYTEGRKNRR